jgi:hypothetical protein
MKTINQALGVGNVTGGPLAWLRFEGGFAFILSILLYAHTGASWWRFLILLLVPDVAMAGYWLGSRWGAVFYNVAHSYVGPAVLASAAITASHAAWLPYSLIWSGHIGMDRALGYGLKYPESFKRTHLGLLAKRGEA